MGQSARKQMVCADKYGALDTFSLLVLQPMDARRGDVNVARSEV